MNDETGMQILQLLDVLSVQVAQGHAELRNDIRVRDAKVNGLDENVNGLDAKVDGLDQKIDRLDGRLGRVETRVENLETEVRSFRNEFERRVAPLERRRPKEYRFFALLDFTCVALI